MFLLFMALMVFMFAGCGGDDDDNSPAKDRLMVLTSSVFDVGESYKLYMGDKLSVRGTDARYYVAPMENSDSIMVTLNLQFKDILSLDVPFVITTADNDAAVVFAYNPAGTAETDISTEYGSVIRFGGSTQQLKYDGLNVAGASLSTSGTSVTASAVDVDTSEEIIITLNEDSAIISNESVPSYEYVWHADPNHRDEYFTLENYTDELTESEMLEGIIPLKGVYIAHDVRYMPSTISFSGTAKKDEETEYVAYYSDSVEKEAAAELGTGFEGPYIFASLPANPGSHGNISDPNSNSEITAYSSMTHTESEAYSNPVLHITEGGVYRLKGTWNGQIWVDVGDDSDVTIILDGVNVTCTVAPAIVFRSARECGPTENVVSFDVGRNMLSDDESSRSGAVVLIADKTTNSFKGSNVYRIMKADRKNTSTTKINGTDISDQAKMYKMDGAFYSFVSLAIGAESNNGGGRLNITSTTYEGLCSEMHMLIDSGTVTVTAEDDGVNVNQDDTSVFTMNGGSLKITGKYGDGIDSNGYIIINNGTLDITAAQDNDSLDANTEGPLDANLGVYMSDTVTYTHQAYDPTNDDSDDDDDDSSGSSVVIYGSDNTVLMRINYSTPVKDDSTSSRTIPGSSEIFRLQHVINSFSGIRIKEEEE